VGVLIAAAAIGTVLRHSIGGSLGWVAGIVAFISAFPLLFVGIYFVLAKLGHLEH
jgi:hypothetical protein